MATSCNSIATCLKTNQSDILIADKTVEDTNRVRTSANTCKHCIWESTNLCKHLLTRFIADNFMEITNHSWEWMRTGDSTKQIVRALYISYPIAHRFVNGIFKSARP